MSVGGGHGCGIANGQGGSIASPAPPRAVAALLEQRFAENNGGARGSTPPYPVRLPRRPCCKPEHACIRAFGASRFLERQSEGLKRQGRAQAHQRACLPLTHTCACVCRRFWHMGARLTKNGWRRYLWRQGWQQHASHRTPRPSVHGTSKNEGLPATHHTPFPPCSARRLACLARRCCWHAFDMCCWHARAHPNLAHPNLSSQG